MTATLWLNIERTFLVIERIDRGSPSGVREVSFVLATSELAQVEVPDLDDPDDTDTELDPALYTEDHTAPEFGEETQPVIKEDPWGTVAAGFGLPGGGIGGGSGALPWDGGAMLPDCCDEPPISVTEVTPGGLPFSDLVIYLYDGADAIFVDWIDVPLTWAHLSDSPGGLVAKSCPLIRLSFDLTNWDVTEMAFRRSFAGSAIYTADQFRGQMSVSSDGGQTWTDIVPPAPFGDVEPEMFSWAGKAGTFLYTAWEADDQDTFTGDRGEIFSSEDFGTTWDRMPDPPDVQPNRISMDADTPGHFAWDPSVIPARLIWTAIGDHPGGDPADDTQTGSVDTNAATVEDGESNDQWTDFTRPFFVPFEDYAILTEWGANRRIIYALHQAAGDGSYLSSGTITELRSVIITLDPDGAWSWPNPQFDGVYAYTGADLGKCIGIVRRWTTETLFAGWEDGTILRSTDNGSSWEEMTKFADFSEAHAIAYDQGNDSLWAVGLDAGGDAALHGWSAAASTGGTSVDMTYNLGEVGAITASPGRNIGHLGMIVREHGVGS